MSARHFAIAATASFWLLGTTSALAFDWQLREVSGSVRVALPARAATNGTVGQTLPTGTSVTTGQGSRAVMINGDQRIVVGPSSRTTLAPEQGGVTRILQDLGSALFQVDRRTRPHFRVETPLLAAVVKGTTFTVSVDAQGDRVHVAEGLVEVRSNSGNATSDVPAGATAVVTRDQPAAVDVSAPSASVPVETAAVSVAPIDYSEASGGLVQNPAGSVAAATVAAPASSASPTGFGEAASGSPYASPSVAGVQAVADLNRNNGPVPGASNPGNANPGNGNAGVNAGNGSGPSNPGNGNGNAGGSAGNGSGNSNSGNGNGNGNGGESAGTPGNGNAGGNAGNSDGNSNSGNGNGNAGGNAGNSNSGNGNSGGETGAGNPGNGNVGGNASNGGGNSNPGNGNGNSGGETGAVTPGNGNGSGNAGNGGGSSNPGNGNGAGETSAGNTGNGVGNGNAGGNAGNGGGTSNPGNGNGGGAGSTGNSGNGNGGGNANTGAGNGNGNASASIDGPAGDRGAKAGANGSEAVQQSPVSI